MNNIVVPKSQSVSAVKDIFMWSLPTQLEVIAGSDIEPYNISLSEFSYNLSKAFAPQIADPISDFYSDLATRLDADKLRIASNRFEIPYAFLRGNTNPNVDVLLEMGFLSGRQIVPSVWIISDGRIIPKYTDLDSAVTDERVKADLGVVPIELSETFRAGNTTIYSTRPRTLEEDYFQQWNSNLKFVSNFDSSEMSLDETSERILELSRIVQETYARFIPRPPLTMRP